MTHPLHSVLLSHNYFKIDAPVRPSGCNNGYWRLTAHYPKDTPIDSNEVRRHTAKFRNAFISHSQQRWSHIHGDTTQIDAKTNGPTSHRDWKSSTTRMDENTSHEILEETENTSRMNGSRRRNWAVRSICPLRPSRIPSSLRRKRSISLLGTLSQQHSTKERNHKNMRWMDKIKLGRSMITHWIESGKTMPIFVCSMPKMVRKFWKGL